MLRGLDKLKYLDLSLSDLVLHAFTFLRHLKDNYFETQQCELLTVIAFKIVVSLLFWRLHGYF